jgi:hypothetical protein
MEPHGFLRHIDRSVAPLCTYTIYDHPLDCPEKFVVRQFVVATGPDPVPGPIVAETETLAEAREAIPRGLICFPRQPGDDPVIVETWL